MMMPAIPSQHFEGQKPCLCTGPCTGYDSRSDCPPYIVLAVLATSGLEPQQFASEQEAQ